MFGTFASNCTSSFSQLHSLFSDIVKVHGTSHGRRRTLELYYAGKLWPRFCCNQNHLCTSSAFALFLSAVLELSPHSHHRRTDPCFATSHYVVFINSRPAKPLSPRDLTRPQTPSTLPYSCDCSLLSYQLHQRAGYLTFLTILSFIVGCKSLSFTSLLAIAQHGWLAWTQKLTRVFYRLVLDVDTSTLLLSFHLTTQL
jgi:hypothetical protein